MKTPFEQKLEHFEKSFTSDESLLVKADGEKLTPKEYIKSLGADKFSPSKLKREMDHHKSMAGMTGDAGHMHVYEHLSEIHKNHPMHEEGDAMEKKTLSAAKAKKTKAKNVKAKAKDAKAAEKGKEVEKTGAKQEKQAQKGGKDKKGALKEDEKYSSKDKKSADGKVDTKGGDSKHVEVKVVINKSEHELDLLAQLGITGTDMLEKAKGKYGKGKHYENIVVQGKKGMHTRHQLVGEENVQKKHKVNANSTVGGATPFGALINNLVAMKVEATGENKGHIETELAYAMGYGIMPDGSKKTDKYGNLTDVKSNIRKIVAGSSNPSEAKKAMAAAFFEQSHNDLQDLEKKSVAGAPQKINDVDFEEVKTQSSGFNYDMIRELVNGDMPRQPKMDALFKQGIKNGGIIARLLGDATPYNVMDIMEERGIEQSINDGFDMAEFREEAALGVKRRTVDSKFAGYRTAVNILVNGDIGFVFAYGAGGVGKSWHADNVFNDAKLRPFDFDDPSMEMNGKDYDYVVVSGRGGMGAAIRHFYNHRDKLIVFDDYDSMVKPSSTGKSDMANILKGAFDGGKKVRRIMHGMELQDGDDVIPKSFRFGGNALMITNLTKNEVPQPILSRTGGNIFDLTMDLSERLELINKIWETDKVLDKDGNEMDIPYDIRKQALDFINKHAMDKKLLDFNKGDSISPRLFKGLVVDMKNYAQMNEKQLIAALGKDWENELPEQYFSKLLQAA